MQANTLMHLDAQGIIRKVVEKRRLAVAAVMLLKLKKRKRRWWINPKIQQMQQGNGADLMRELRLSDEMCFFNNTRLNLQQFDLLLSMMKDKLTKKNTFRKPISSDVRLALTLRHLATGDSLPSLASAFGIGKSTACTIIKETCDIIWDSLSPIYLKFPTENEWLEISNSFQHQWNLPHCVGALDARHVVVQAPHKSGTQSEQEFSIVLFAVCDSNYRFTYIDLGAYGSENDGGVLRESIFGSKLFKGELNLPKDNYITDTNICFPYYFVADEAFPLHTHLIRPYGRQNMDKEKQIFNSRLTKAHKCIENAFGILVSRFRVLHKVINAHPKTVDSIVKAVICLHNFIKQDEQSSASNGKYCPETFVDRYDDGGNVIRGQWRNDIPKTTALDSARQLNRRLGARNSTRVAEENRETLKNYLCSVSGVVQ